MKKTIVIFFGLICLSTLYGQVELFPERPKGTLSTGMQFTMWRWEKSDGSEEYLDSVNQMCFPITLTVPVTRKVSLTINHIPALAWWYDDRKINGLSDTWVQANGLFWKDRMVWNVGMGVPTGKTRLDQSQFDLSRQLSRTIFRYHLPVYGQGFCSRFGWAIAIPLREELVFGGGIQYLHRSAYHPVEFSYKTEGSDEEKMVSTLYDPGNQLDLHAGFDILIQENSKIMIDGFLSLYSADYSNHQKVYEAGTKTFVNLAYFHRFRDKYLWAQLRYRKKGKNQLWQGMNQTGNQITEGNQFELDTIFEALRFTNSGVLFLVNGRFYGRNDSGTGGANVMGVGIGNYLDFWETSRFNLTLQYMFGTLHDELGGKKLRRSTDGLEISAGVDLAF